MNSLKVANNISGKISQIRVGKSTGNTYDASRWDSADIVVGGIFSSTITTVHYYTALGGSVDVGQFYYKIGAINQYSVLNFQSRVATSGSQAYANYMITGGASTNGGTAVMSGNIGTSVFNGGVNKPLVHLFMNSSDGKLTQSFSGKNIQIAGGITVMSGTLLFNFAETSGLNHGDLTMEGGKFGNTNTAGSAFLLSDLVYSGGTIGLAVNSADKLADSLTLSGTAKLAEGSSAKVALDFGSDLAWLVDNTDNDGKGVKVISWGEKTLEADSFIANAYSSLENTYNANFTSTADGLYVKYVAVPEPSTVAAIFGALALALAAYRRRK